MAEQIKSLKTGIKYKDTPIGKIPVDWEIKKIEYLTKESKGAIKIGPFGSQIKKSEMVNVGIRVYGQENVYRKDFNIGKNYITLEKFKELKTVEIFPGDLLITMMGTIGDCCIVPVGIQRGIMDSHLMRIQLKDDINPSYVEWLIRESSLVKKQINDMLLGGIMSGLNLSIIKEIKIPIPPLAEQKKIAEILSSVDEAIEKTEQVIEKTKEAKKGLMQVLLTGKIRVET